MALLPSVYSRTLLVWCLAEIGEFEEGLAVAEQAVRIAEDIDHPYSKVYAQLGLGRVLSRQGELGRAIATLESSRALCESAEVPVLFSLVVVSLGVAYAQSGRSEEALALLSEARHQAKAVGLRVVEPLSLSALGEAYLRAGRVVDALATARESVKVTRASRARGSLAWALRLLGEAAADQNPPAIEESEQAYGEALSLASELAMAPLVARCHLGRGLLYLGVGREDGVLDLERAAIILRRLNMPRWLQIAEDTLTVHRRAIDPDRSRSHRRQSE
jgi:tetratricopeptide (TPR) repeat protein